MDAVTHQNQQATDERVAGENHGDETPGGEKATRRRGAELEAALLAAAWEVLTEGGYNGFTFDAIAEQAQTSKPVLYRRWPTRGDLLRATLRWHGDVTALPVPDTGNLREDVVALLRSRNGNRSSMAALMSVQLGNYFAESGTTPADLRREIIGSRGGGMRMLTERAAARGECPSGLPERVVTLPFDLFRAETMLTLRPVPDEVILQIVDVIWLPLLQAHQPRPC
jgi:AcrR family transcriptional regulator